MKNWNFHGYIAVPLETYSKKYIGTQGRTADKIELGEFVLTMLLTLQAKFGSLDDFKDFIFMCEDYVDLPANQIPQDKAQKIFDEFTRLIKL